MRVSLQSGMISAVALIAAGCGGGTTGRTTTTINPGTNPYFGTYSGEMYSDTLKAPGALKFTVENTSALSGSYVIGSVTTTFTGTMSQTGLATITDNNGMTSTGQFGASNGSTNEASMSGSSVGTLLFTVVRNPVGPKSGGNAFNGDYTGTVTNQTTGTTEPISLAVDTNGSVSGDDVIDSGLAPELGSVGGSISTGGAASLAVTVTGSAGTTINGNLTLAGNTLTGTGTNTAGNTLQFKMNLF